MTVLHSQSIEIGKSFRFDFPPLHDIDKPFDMIWVPAGTFMMGSPLDEVGRALNEDQFEVTLTDGFWLGKYPVTFAHWLAILDYITNGAGSKAKIGNREADKACIIGF
jgi:hypothetical protein